MAKIETKNNFRVAESLIDTDRVVFVFTAMGTKIGLYRLFVKALNKSGYSVITYDYPVSLVHEANFDTWNEFFSAIIADARQRLAFLQTQGTKHFYAYGVSMGTLLANKLARTSPEINHVVLNMTYGDVATNIWVSPATRKTKANLVKRGTPIDVLRQAVVPIDPIVNAQGLVGKKVLLHLAKRDRILDYKITRETKKAFEAAGVNMQYIESKYLGHFIGGAKHMLGIRRLKEFFNS